MPGIVQMNQSDELEVAVEVCLNDIKRKTTSSSSSVRSSSHKKKSSLSSLSVSSSRKQKSTTGTSTCSKASTTSSAVAAAAASKLEVEELREAFRLFDMEQTGRISVGDLRGVLRELQAESSTIVTSSSSIDQQRQDQQQQQQGRNEMPAALRSLERILYVIETLPDDETLSVDDFVHLMTAKAIKKKKNIKSLINEEDTDNTDVEDEEEDRRRNQRDYHSYLSMAASTLSVNSMDDDEMCDKEELTRVFELFDVEGKGYITREDLTRVAYELGESLDDSELEEMILRAAPNGRVTLKEFTDIMNKKLFA